MILVICFLFVISLELGLGKKFIEPIPLGIHIKEIKNKTKSSALLINIFTQESYSINPNETKVINTWLPNCNYKITFFGITIEQGYKDHPDNRLLVLATDSGIRYLVFGKTIGLTSNPHEKESLWVITDGWSSKRALSINDYNVPLQIEINDSGLSIPNTEVTMNIMGAMSNFDWYKYKLGEKFKQSELPLILRKKELD